MTDTETDTVVLSFPRATKYYGVARLVVGGMAAPLQMSYDALDDLQLAISSLLDRADLALQGDDTEVQLHLEVSEARLVAKIGGFADGDAGRALDTDASADASGTNGLGLRRLLDTIVDDVSVDGHAAGGEWVTLVKNVKASA
jgi:anti-sigma regulatory factor (Ser/Thr protein kinase)